MSNLYGQLKNKTVAFVKAMYNLPGSPVWVHENVLYNVIGITTGDTFGKKDVMTYLLQGIKKGYFGNKKTDSINLDYDASDLSQESNAYNMTYQVHGDYENFDGGTLQQKVSSARPRWFRKGTPVTNVKTQTNIVNALIGNEKGLSEEVSSRRRNNFKSFIRDENNESGYERNDVMKIIDDYKDELNIRRVRGSRYAPTDLKRVKDVLRLMIVASNKCGKLEVNNGRIVPVKSLRPARGNVTTTTQPAAAAVTPAVKKRTTQTQCTPKEITFTATPRKSHGALKLESIRCTSNGMINMLQVKELSSLELLFHLYTTNLRLYDDANEAAETTKEQMKELNVSLPNTFDSSSLASLTSQELNKSNNNIQIAIKEAVKCLHGMFTPQEGTMLYNWIGDSQAYTNGCAVQTPNNFEQGTYNKHQTSMTLEAAWILRHIIYTHHLPVRKALMFWAEYHVLILRKPVNPDWFVAEKTLWYHIHRLTFIDNALLTLKYADTICTRTKNGFRRCNYVSSDDSKHFDHNEHICTITTKKYWNELEIDGRRPNYRVLWISAVKTFPLLLPFHRGTIQSVEDNHITIISNKTTATTVIGSYLKMAKKVTKLICDFCHGTDSNHRNFVPKRERKFIQSDLLEVLDFVKVVDVSGSTNAVEESAANACLSTFQIIDDHYTYTRSNDDVLLTLSSDDVPADDGDAADVDAEVEEVQPNVDSNGPRRSSMRRRRPNSRRIYPGEESSSEEEESEDEQDSDDAPVPFV